MIGGNLTEKTRKALIAFKGTHAEASRALGVAITTARKVRRAAGVESPRKTPWDEHTTARLVKLIENGLTNPEIAAKLGMTRDQVSAKALAMCLRPPDRPPQIAPWVARAIAALEAKLPPR